MHRIPHIVLLILLAPVVSSADNVPLLDGRLDPAFVQCFVQVEGGQLSCFRRPGSGPVLLLIPGTFSDARYYVATVRELVPAFELLILENRGLGGSWPPPESSSIEACASDAIAVLDALNIDACYVGGHSLGGMIAIELGRQIPERVLGIVSIEGWTNSRAASDAFQSDMKSTLSPEQLAEMEAYRADVLRRWTPEQRSMFGRIWRQWDGAEILRATTLPVLELYGDRNRPRPDPSLLGIPKRDNIRLVWLGGASHSLPLERPRDVAAEINRFIAECEQMRSPAAPH